MTDQKLFAPELKPWESDPKESRLSPSSYAATAVFGLVELAVEHVDELGLEVNAGSVGKYSKLFARILIRAQVELGSGGAWSSALNTRLRGALRTALRVLSYDETDQDTAAESFKAWEQDLYDLVISISKTAAWLYGKTPQELMA
jgi:hypothetical protein